MAIFEHQEYSDHERVTFFHDLDTSLFAINAIHRLRNGKSGGGIRFFPYKDSAAAVLDVLRLSRAMSYKMVLSGLPVGGGKTVVIGEPAKDKTPDLLHALGRCIDNLDGQYICGPDVGTNSADMAVIREVTPHVVGLPGEGRDTSTPTARGVFHGIQAAANFRLGRDNLRGLTVAVQGVGAVGSVLCSYLRDVGAQLIIADVKQEAVESAARELDAKVVDPDEILFVEADVIAPCAMGAVLNDESIPKIKAVIVCGGANNQLAAPRHGQLLKEIGILFAPDYVVNSGGALSGITQAGLIAPEQFETKLSQIYDTTLRIFEIATAQNVSTDEAAQSLAEELLAKGKVLGE